MNKIRFTNDQINLLGLNNDEIDSDLLPSGEGISSDLVIFPKLEEIQQKSQLVLAIGKPVIFDPITKRPIGGILSINKIIPSIPNNYNYLESVIVHQLTHILGFLYELFDKYTIGFNNVIKTGNETRTNNEKKFIISPKYHQKLLHMPKHILIVKVSQELNLKILEDMIIIITLIGKPEYY